MQVNTNENTLIAKIVGLVIALVVVGMVLVPFVNDATTTENTFTNEGLWRMKEIENGDEWTFTSSPFGWECNDVAQTSILSVGWNGMCGDTWLIRANGQARGPEISGNAVTLTAVADEINITFEGVSGTLVYPISGYGIDDTGDYLLSSFNVPTYVLDDSPVYATGISTVGEIGIVIHIEGTIKDGFTFDVMDNRNTSNISNVEVSDINVISEKVTGYTNLYKLTSISATISLDNTAQGVTTPHTGTVTYSSYIVPYEVSAELSEHASNIEITLYQMIPILVVLGLIVGIVGLLAYNRHGN